MLKKSLFLLTLVLLSVNIIYADDVIKENSNSTDSVKYKLPDKEVDQFSKDEILSAGSYLQGVLFGDGLANDKTLDTKNFIDSYEKALKDPTLTVDTSELNQLSGQYQTLKSQGKAMDPEKAARLNQVLGIFYARSLTQNQMRPDLFIAGIKDRIANTHVKVAEEKQKQIFARFQDAVLQQIKEIGQKFMQENKTKEGIITLESGVQYQILQKGNGNIAKDGQTIKVHYVGTTIDGKEFDSSIKHGETFNLKVPVTDVIEGWIEVLKLMNKGSKWKVFIPENLAYKEKGAPPYILPYSPLIFEMEIIDITP